MLVLTPVAVLGAEAHANVESIVRCAVLPCDAMDLEPVDSRATFTVNSTPELLFPLCRVAIRWLRKMRVDACATFAMNSRLSDLAWIEFQE
jgi:hypothetical protein